MDTLTKNKRSKLMSKIRSEWTKPEVFAHNALKGNKVRHRMHPDIIGNPDILIKKNNIILFIDGCFWHKCPRHYRLPKTNKAFWLNKINNNIKRRGRVLKEICWEKKYKAKRIWECRLSSRSLLDAAGAA